MNIKPPRRILIADENGADRSTLCEVLKRANYAPLEASSATQALELAETQPDLIILDVTLPDLDGYEVCRRLKASRRTENIPVIFLTAVQNASAEEQGIRTGAVDYITKPYRPPIVLARIASHLELRQKLDQLNRLATQDALTGIANRHRFEEFLHFEWMRSMRARTPVSLVMIDVDHFKAFNDLYGHAAGDDCLQRVAGAMRDALSRAADLLARYGGEEFVCVLHDTEHAGALQVAEQLRQAVMELAIPHAGSRAASHVSISLGVASIRPTQDTAPIELVETADTRLYQAKRLGRNQVMGDTPNPAGLQPQETDTPSSLPQILIVDDEPMQINLLGSMLKQEHVVSIALNGEQALRRSQMSPQPDIILLDVVMPGMDGYEICRRLKANPATAEIPVIFITAMNDEEDEAKGLEVGAVDYLSKPLKQAIVQARIKLQLKLRQTLAQLSDKNVQLEQQLRQRAD